MSDLKYLSGFGNEFSSEAVTGCLPVGRNNPQKVKYGLYAEQLSGSAFTALPHENRRSWLYRLAPSVSHSAYSKIENGLWRSAPFNEVPTAPDQFRWSPAAIPEYKLDFVEGLSTICGNGDVLTRTGSTVHLYHLNSEMTERVLINADGEMLIVPQAGSIRVTTEFGRLDVAPKEIVILPRGIKFKVDPLVGESRGYVLENYGEPFVLPYRGPIGANGLANVRDFLTPIAWFEDIKAPIQLVTKFCGNLWSCELDNSPFDVVGWHGNYAPYKYDLGLFNTMNSVSFDHPDPSIFTVLTSPTAKVGTANVDFVIFPPRWMVAEDTFRPPYFHRNVMSEYMGLIHGVYDAKPAGGFEPGGGSLHNCMTPHGPEAKAFESASAVALKPQYLGDTLAFMFESCFVYCPTKYAMNSPTLQKNYLKCWDGMKRGKI